MSAASLADGYEVVRLPTAHAFVWGPAAPWLRDALRAGTRLHDWAGRHARGGYVGRGPVHVVPAATPGPDGRSSWAVRHYRRGGVAARLLDDLYWGPFRSRPERELEASLHARAHGVRTPAVIAGAVYRAGFPGAVGAYRADLVTEEVPNARALASVLDGSAAPVVDALRGAGAIVRTMERAALIHPDVSAGNILIDDAGDAWVIDLDRARHLARPGPRVGLAMLERLERSLRKRERTGDRTLRAEEWAALRSGFAGSP